MKRPIGIVLTSVLQYLGSLPLMVIGVLVMVVLTRFAPRIPDSQPKVLPGFFFAIGAMYLVFAVVGVATAVDVFRMKRWARYSTLIFAVILVFQGLIGALIFAFIPFPPPPGQPSSPLPHNFAPTFRIVLVLVQLALAGLGGWWLYYFSRKPIRDRFEGATTDGISRDSRPLSIVMLGVLCLFGSPWMLVGLWLEMPILLFGILVHGSVARLVYAALFALNLYLGIGLLRLVPASRLVAIGLYLYGCVNTVLFCVLPGRDERYQRMLAEYLRAWRLPNLSGQRPQSWAGIWLGMIVSLAICALAIYFLIARRSAFENRGAVLPPPEPSLLA